MVMDSAGYMIFAFLKIDKESFNMQDFCWIRSFALTEAC
jgi:hypothetical protein